MADTITEPPPSASSSCRTNGTMDDVSIEKIQIAGPTLASILSRFSSSQGAIHGLLFGHVAVSTPVTLTDDSGSPPANDDTPPLLLTAITTSFLSVPSHLPLPDPPASTTVIGWFSGRRRTALRPSLNDYTTTRSISSNDSLYFSAQTLTLAPSLFLLLTTPFQDQLIHTTEYKAYQYRIPTDTFEARSLSIVNIGPSFRSNYGSFTPNSMFPRIHCDFRSPNAMSEDEGKEETTTLRETLGELKNSQRELNQLAEGFEIGRLNRLVGPDATKYTSEVDDMYNKMLAKLKSLAKLAEETSAKVLEQENINKKLRLKVADME